MVGVYNFYKSEQWKILEEGKLVYNNKIAYRLEIGEWKEGKEEGKLSVLMLKEVYEKIMSREYSVICHPNTIFTVINKKNQIVDLLG